MAKKPINKKTVQDQELKGFSVDVESNSITVNILLFDENDVQVNTINKAFKADASLQAKINSLVLEIENSI